MELRWLEDPDTRERKLQYRESRSNGVYGPGSVVFDTGWVDIPVVVDVPTATDVVIDPRLPAQCRERLRLEGSAYPKSGCAVCGDGGIRGCPCTTKD